MQRLLFLLFFLFTAGVSANAQSKTGFVGVRGHQLMLNGKPWYYIGANYWYGGLLAHDTTQHARVSSELDFMQQHGIKSVRVLAGAEGSGYIVGTLRVGPPLQPQKGVFDTTTLTGLDFLLAELDKRQMKAVIYLSNNWDWSGGFLQYLHWNGLLPDSVYNHKLDWEPYRDYESKFYTCTPCLQQYTAQLKLIVTRTNSITGKAYKDDPAIMAWEIANEPRPMRPVAVPAYNAWLHYTAALLKTLDPNHLVTIGSEGYFGSEGIANFRTIHADKNIDYATIHIWPKNWGWFKDTAIAAGWATIVKETNDYTNKHIAVAKAINKPLVLEEFGLPRNNLSFSPASPTTLRDKYYALFFERLLNSSQHNDVIAGASFWAFGGSGRPSGKQPLWVTGDDILGDPPMEEQGLNTVFDSDSTTWACITTYAKKIAAAKGIIMPLHTKAH